MGEKDTPSTFDRQGSIEAEDQPEKHETEGIETVEVDADDNIPGSSVPSTDAPSEEPSPPGEVETQVSTPQDQEPPPPGQGAADLEAHTNRSAESENVRQSAHVWRTVLLVAFYPLMAVVIWFLFFRAESATVFVDLPKQETGEISVKVLHEGRTENVFGQMHLLVEEFLTNVAVADRTIAIDGGTATFGFENIAGLKAYLEACKHLVVVATFDGYAKGGSDGTETTPISGSTHEYINMPRPWHMGWVSGIVLSVLTLVVVEIVFFSLSVDPRRMPWMFRLMYFNTFISIFLPFAITLIVPGNPYLIELMKEAPIGLVRGAVGDNDNSQWLLNIGGDVTPATVSPTCPAGGAGHVVNGLQPASGDLGQLLAHVHGGIVVPFYMIALAMLGAGINMTLQVPKIQERYDKQSIRLQKRSGYTFQELADILATPLGGSAPQERELKPHLEAAAQARSDLIHNYMYLLSAPFLAIAAYYLLQLVGNDIGTPILVIVGFATGIVSDKVVKAITRVGGEALDKTGSERLPSGATDQGKDKSKNNQNKEEKIEK